MKLLIVWLLAAAFLSDSIVRALRTNFNLGALMMYLITAMLWCYAIFHRQIDALCSAGAGRVLKDLFWAGCAVFAALMIFVAAAGHANPADCSEKAVIVLGAGLRGEKVTGMLERRLQAACDYHLQNPDAPIIVTGGQGHGESIPEARAMKKWLVENGVDPSLIYEEDKSVSTEENFAFARRITQQLGLAEDAPVAYVTSSFHCYRASKYAAAAGFRNAKSVPSSIGFTSVLPSYMREVLAVLYYWVFRR